MFFDEEMLLDLRLNIMDKYIDKFVITEATYTHSGNPKKLIFDINKFSKFKDKIIYIVVDKPPPDLFNIDESDNNKQDTRGQKLILNGYKRDNYQRQMAQQALGNIEPDDWVIINDIDEVPNLKNVNFKDVRNKFVIFKQQIFYYKFNYKYTSTTKLLSGSIRRIEVSPLALSVTTSSEVLIFKGSRAVVWSTTPASSINLQNSNADPSMMGISSSTLMSALLIP